MRVQKPVLYLLAWLACMITSLAAWQSVALAATAPQGEDTFEAGESLDDATCLNCHDGKLPITVADEDDEERPLLAIEPKKYLKGIHGDMACIDCHKEIVDSKAQHEKSDAPKPSCITCHEDLWEAAREQGLTKEKARLGVIVQNIEAYKESFHAKRAPSRKLGVKAHCEDCHDSHFFNVPPRGTAKRTEWHMTVPAVCSEACHEDSLEEYMVSVHGKEAIENHNLKTAVCTDCHTTHDISKTTRDPFQLLVTKQCGSCHEEQFATYRDTYHGQINTLGYAYTAKCFDCHGSHEILRVDDPESTVHPDNRIETCAECHDGKDVNQATESFLSFGPHAHTHDYDRYPQMWIVGKFMHALLLFVFAFFWAHSLMWWYREYRDRKARKGQARIRTDEVLDEDGKQVHRFGLAWRLGHLFFALSVMILILTGMAVYYAYTAWAPVVIELLGGPEMAGLIHRISAAIMLGIFFTHLVVVSINIARKGKTFRWFGPDSLVPNWKDLKDAWGMFVWFVGKGPKPSFDRWTYWEKFDYWAVFWGMAIIGGSGMLLSFPDITAALLPGWAFNVVMLVHGEEAFLAAVFLFTVHFFNNHFRPDKLPPPDVVMFTGTQSLEEFRRDHRLQYDRLVETGQLDNYLVDAPSRPMTIGSKILGLTLITIGLVLLFVVAAGFFEG